MKIQPIYYREVKPGQPFHQIHGEWVRSIQTEKAKPFIPDFFLKRPFFWHPILSQALAFVQGLFIPKADVYLCETMACVPATWKRSKKAKVIVINSDTFFYDMSRGAYVGREKKMNIYRRWLLKKVTGIISTSNLMKGLANKFTDVPNEVVYPFVDERYFKVNAKFNSNKICYFGRFVHEKNINDVVSAFDQSKTAKELVLIGCPDDYLKNHYRSSGKKITCVSWVDLPEAFAKECGLFINVAYMEPFGVNTIEAMAMGMIPIVGFNVGSRDAVENVDDKLLVPTISEMIAEKIDQLNKNKEEKKVISELCKIEASKYTKENSITSFKSALWRLSQ